MRGVAAPRSIVVRTTTEGSSGTAQPVVVDNTGEKWEKFAENASGEWEGVIVTFDEEGKPQPLPDRFVPEAFREWGVAVCDWQAQCSMLASDGTLQYRVRRMMPTVGCEADAVAFTEESTSHPEDAQSSSRTVLEDGSYMTGPVSLSPDDSSAAIELCLVLPAAEQAGDDKANDAGRRRVRVIVTMMRNWKTKAWRAARFEVAAERYECEYRGGQDLELLGCHGASTISDLPVVDELDAATSGWEAVGGTVDMRSVDSVPRLSGDAATTCMPNGLFGRVTVPPGSTEDFMLELGAVAAGSNARRVARVVYKGHALSSCALIEEARCS